jgi:hypothetical protein
MRIMPAITLKDGMPTDGLILKGAFVGVGV